MIWLILFLFIATILWYLYQQLVVNKKYQNPNYLQHLEQIKLFLQCVNQWQDYVTWVEKDRIKNQWLTTDKFFRSKTDFYKQEPLVKQFNEIYPNLDGYVVQYNQNYVVTQKQKLQDYFNDIEGKQLDEQQRTAVVTDEYSNLIIAGAGSGKTLTIMGKVKYLVEKKQVKPENILLLSFTKKTVEELNERLQKMGLAVRATTFHKLGFDTIKKYQSNVPKVTNENTLGKIVKEYISKQIFENQKAMHALVEYVACYMNIPKENDSYESLGEKLDTEKGTDFQTMKTKCEPELNKIAKPTLDALQGEKVRSIEELTIANFLYLNGINYEYEKKYPHGEGLYQPDFYLLDYDIYLEHFGVDENNRAKWLTPYNEQKYLEDMAWKRETHQKYQTKLLETYSYYNKNKELLDKLREILEQEQVVFKPRNLQEVFEKVTSNDQHFGKEIINLLETFIHLSKSRKLEEIAITKLFTDSKKQKNAFMLQRQKIFLQFALPVLKRYNQWLEESGEIDFNDMINHATYLLQIQKPTYAYQHIIIDEYQDISYARFQLIKTIRELSSARLICVGDDWQSIYRFAGSDISLFSNFEKYVGKYEQLFIEQTYRNSQKLIDITANYIQKNKKQIQKNPKSKKSPVENPIQMVYYTPTNAEEVFIQEVKKILEKYGNHPILVLGRHRFDINEFIKLTPNSKLKFNERTNQLFIQRMEEVQLQFITVHKSKGLEAENVIVLNLKNHLLGFPNKMTDDPMLSLLLSDDEEFRFAEERRLFYVALTRTKNQVVLLIPTEVSVFAEELLTDPSIILTANNEKLSQTNCPYCQTGHLMIRENFQNKNQFLGCSHYPSCNQTFKDVEILENSILCSKCQSGFMVKKTGPYSTFFGCTNYPKCDNTIKLKS